MKIFSAAQIREWDAATIQRQNISSATLMERAATACTAWLSARFAQDTLFLVLCGMGNNGGDGLAIARLLDRQGYGVKAFVLQHRDEASPDHVLNRERLQAIDEALVSDLAQGTFITDIPPHIVIIDALMGSGLSRPLQDWPAAFVTHINRLPNRKIAIDLPSGLATDELWPDAVVLKADDTLSFQALNRTFLHPEGALHCGRIQVLDIGLDPAYAGATASQYHTVDQALVQSLYRPRQAFSHKGTYGTAFIVAGSYGMIGAAVLAARAAGRAGAGKVRVLTPECGYAILQTLVPEAMTETNGRKHLTAIEGWEQADAVGAGPGIGTEPETGQALARFIDACKEPVVLDADALNIIGRHKDLLSRLPAGSILTPHPKEFERLFGPSADTLRRVELARAMAMKYNLHILLKDRHSTVTTPDGECWYNLTGNAGMATGGSGDVLLGILTGLLAQGYEPKAAALLGMYLHGCAGDEAAAKYGQEAMVAGDIADCIGDAYRSLKQTA